MLYSGIGIHACWLENGTKLSSKVNKYIFENSYNQKGYL